LIENESDSEQNKTMSLVSKSGTALGSLVGGGTAGAADANSVTTTTTQHTITGGLELEEFKSKWPGLGLVCGLELGQALIHNNGNTVRFGVGDFSGTYGLRVGCVFERRGLPV
jgi:hypothetical protein